MTNRNYSPALRAELHAIANTHMARLWLLFERHGCKPKDVARLTWEHAGLGPLVRDYNGRMSTGTHKSHRARIRWIACGAIPCRRLRKEI